MIRWQCCCSVCSVWVDPKGPLSQEQFQHREVSIVRCFAFKITEMERTIKACLQKLKARLSHYSSDGRAILSYECWNVNGQECIPVGCIPTAAVASSGCQYPGVCLQMEGVRVRVDRIMHTSETTTFPPGSVETWFRIRFLPVWTNL